MTQISSRDFKIYDLHELRNLPCARSLKTLEIFSFLEVKKKISTNLPSSLYQGSSKGNQKVTPLDVYVSNIEINQPRRPRETISLSHFIPKNLSVSLDRGACRNVYTASRSQYTCTRDRGKGRTSVDLASDWSRGLSPHPPLT